MMVWDFTVSRPSQILPTYENSGKSGTDLWRISDISAQSGMIGKKQNPRSSRIFPTYENQALLVCMYIATFLLACVTDE